MTEDISPRTRKRPAKGVLQISGQSTIVFVTVCARHRKPWIATDQIHAALTQIWRDDATAWLTGKYVLMPDHVHLFAAPADDQTEIETWIKYWKRRLCQACQLPAHPWQENAFHSRMRSADMYQQKWHYVLDNPVRQGLVKSVEDWPYSGEVSELRW